MRVCQPSISLGAVNSQRALYHWTFRIWANWGISITLHCSTTLRMVIESNEENSSSTYRSSREEVRPISASLMLFVLLPTKSE